MQESSAFGSAVKAAAEFLEPDTSLSRQLTHLLFLFREAGKDTVQLEIRILALCALLESLVRTIFKEVCQSKTDALDTANAERFAILKERFLKRAAQLRNTKNYREHDTLCDRIRGASVSTTQDVFKAVSSRLNLPWREVMQPLFREWKKARNPSAHGDFKPDIAGGVTEQKAVEEMFFGLSRIAGGLNTILLKLFGYSGPYRASALEDQHRRL